MSYRPFLTRLNWPNQVYSCVMYISPFPILWQHFCNVVLDILYVVCTLFPSEFLCSSLEMSLSFIWIILITIISPWIEFPLLFFLTCTILLWYKQFSIYNFVSANLKKTNINWIFYVMFSYFIQTVYSILFIYIWIW